MARPNSRPGRSCKTMDETMAVVDEPGTRVPRLYRRWECVNIVLSPDTLQIFTGVRYISLLNLLLG